MYACTVCLYNTSPPPPLRVYIHNHCPVHLSSPAQLCASHKEELADLNTRLSAQEEEMCQKAQLVITLQVRTYIHTEHLSAALSFNPIPPTFSALCCSFHMHFLLKIWKYICTYVRMYVHVSQMPPTSPTCPLPAPHCMTDAYANISAFLVHLYTLLFCPPTTSYSSPGQCG